MQAIRKEIRREGENTIYELVIPWKALDRSLSAKDASNVRFDIAINDNDGCDWLKDRKDKVFKQIELTRGIIDTKEPNFSHVLLLTP